MKVLNLPRFAAKHFSHMPKNTIWISISEPDCLDSVVQNEFLDQLPKLRLSCSDLTNPVEHGGEMLFPPSPSVARAIVDFILSKEGMHVLVNCAAGVSRSGAVAQFCEECLGYEWIEMGKRSAHPNPVLFGLMKDYYYSIKFDGKEVLTAYEKALLRTQ